MAPNENIGPPGMKSGLPTAPSGENGPRQSEIGPAREDSPRQSEIGPAGEDGPRQK